MGCYFCTKEDKDMKRIEKTDYELPEFDYCHQYIGISAVNYVSVCKTRDVFEQLTTNHSFI